METYSPLFEEMKEHKKSVVYYHSMRFAKKWLMALFAVFNGQILSLNLFTYFITSMAQIYFVREYYPLTKKWLNF